jgi:hypothetical protein
MTLRDRDGIRHLALRPNDDDAWWTPIACGGGIVLPGIQRDEEPDCAACEAAKEKP